MAKERMSGKDVWVLKFSSKYGTEVHLFSSERLADRAAVEIVKDNLGSLMPDEADQVERAIRERRWSEAINLFNESQEESMEPMTVESDQWTIDGFFRSQGAKEWIPE